MESPINIKFSLTYILILDSPSCIEHTLLIELIPSLDLCSPPPLYFLGVPFLENLSKSLAGTAQLLSSVAYAPADIPRLIEVVWAIRHGNYMNMLRMAEGKFEMHGNCNVTHDVDDSIHRPKRGRVVMKVRQQAYVVHRL